MNCNANANFSIPNKPSYTLTIMRPGNVCNLEGALILPKTTLTILDWENILSFAFIHLKGLTPFAYLYYLQWLFFAPTLI